MWWTTWIRKCEFKNVYNSGTQTSSKLKTREAGWLNVFVTQSLMSWAKNEIKNTTLSCRVRVFMPVSNQTQSTANSAHWVWRQKLPMPQILAEMRLQVITSLGEIFSHTAAFLYALAPSVGTDGGPQRTSHLISWLQDWYASLLHMILNIKYTSSNHLWPRAEDRTFTGNWNIGLLQLNISQT